LNSLVVKMVTRSVFTSRYYHDNAHAAKSVAVMLNNLQKHRANPHFSRPREKCARSADICRG
jgi:hypothetical protein